jgi:hypothetical protein
MALGILSRWFGRSKRASGTERSLLDRCHGDQQLMERLIAAEVARRPGISRVAASQSAIERWKRDR